MRFISLLAVTVGLLAFAPSASAAVYCDSCAGGTLGKCCDKSCPCVDSLECDWRHTTAGRCVDPATLIDAGPDTAKPDTAQPDAADAETVATDAIADTSAADDASIAAPRVEDEGGCSYGRGGSNGVALAAIAAAAAFPRRRVISTTAR